MTKKHILGFILVFLFFLEILPIYAQGLQCDNCGTSITYRNIGKRTKTGYLCKSCYRQQQEQPQNQTQQIQETHKTQLQTQQQAQGIQCDNCGTSITYRNIGKRTKTGYLCKSCYGQQKEPQQQQTQLQQEQQGQIQSKQQQKQRSDFCTVCKKQLEAGKSYYTTTDNRPFCSNCREKYKERCNTCGLPIPTNGKVIDDKTWLACTSCGKNIIWAVCHKPLSEVGGQYHSLNKQLYCLKCKETYKDKCPTCGLPVPPNGVAKNGTCLNCAEKYIGRCRNCGKSIPIGEGVKTGSWLVCNFCSKDIIVTESQLQECYAEACAFMKSYFGLDVWVPFDYVFFSDISEMMELIRRHPESNYVTEAAGLFSEGKKILIQKGLCKDYCIQVLVHESAHACMYRFPYSPGVNPVNPIPTTPMYKEGFADWCTYKYVMSKGKTWHPKQNIVYAEGLRKMLELEKKMKGEKGALEYVETHNDFPKE